jgi:NAD(P)H dehydrogenase (quinone)
MADDKGSCSLLFELWPHRDDGLRGRGERAGGWRRSRGQTVPELAPPEVAKRAGYKLDQAAPIATVDEPDYNAIIIVVPTRFGNMAAQMKNFLDQTGGRWMQGKLVGKVGSVFTASATQHGGQESTILTAHVVLLHQGMVIVGLPYSFQGQMTLAGISGCSPYGASTIAGGDGSRRLSDNELACARFQAQHVATISAKLNAA